MGILRKDEQLAHVRVEGAHWAIEIDGTGPDRRGGGGWLEEGQKEQGKHVDLGRHYPKGGRAITVAWKGAVWRVGGELSKGEVGG